MDTNTIKERIISLEKVAMAAWLKGNPTPFLDIYSKDFTYFDPSQEQRLDGFDRVKDLYESMRGKVQIENFEIINPEIQATDKMAVLTYNLHMHSGDTIWKENCTEVYKLEEDNNWRIVHCHFSTTNPSL